jgi:orotidine-5'-phosphate decarboxylase
MTGLKDPKSRLIFALDVPSLDEAVSFVQKLDGSVGMFKVGLELFIKEGPAVLTAIKDHSDAEIFLDLKLHDIPATVERAVQSAAAHNVRFLTLHCAGGEAMLKAAVNGACDSGLQILGVTVLTSLGPDDHREELGYRKDLTLKDLVVTRAGMAEKAGCAGVVCSGEELTRIHDHLANVMTVVPGIRPANNTVRNDDQKRAMTPKQAIQDGADYLVVGRPIRDAADPKAAAQRIVQEISEALSDTK